MYLFVMLYQHGRVAGLGLGKAYLIKYLFANFGAGFF